MMADVAKKKEERRNNTYHSREKVSAKHQGSGPSVDDPRSDIRG